MQCTLVCNLFFFFKQKTAYDMRISDWSSDVCSSDLGPHFFKAVGMPLIRGREFEEDDTSRSPPADVVVINQTLRAQLFGEGNPRSEESRVGKECVSTCRSRWWPYH